MSQDEELEDTLFENVHKIVFKNVSANGVLKGSSKFADLQHDIMQLIRTREATLIREALERIKQFQYPTGTSTNGKEDFAVSVHYIDELTNQQKGEQ